jgi:hypothetical protein
MKFNVVIPICLIFLFFSCSTSVLQKGIYSNKNGELIKFNSNSTFEFYYYGNNKQVYSSGVYAVIKNNINIKTDSANIIAISDINYSNEGNNNGKVKIIIDDKGYANEREGAISYKVFIDDKLVCDLVKSNEIVIDEIKSAKTISISILTTPEKNVYGPLHNSPIYTKPFNLASKNFKRYNNND